MFCSFGGYIFACLIAFMHVYVLLCGSVICCFVFVCVGWGGCVCEVGIVHLRVTMRLWIYWFVFVCVLVVCVFVLLRFYMFGCSGVRCVYMYVNVCVCA